MAKKVKKEKRARKPKEAGAPKGEGRKPVLAPYVEGGAPFKIYATYKGKEYAAQVLTSGIIKMDEKEYTSPSAAGRAIMGNNDKGKPLQVDGWAFWKYNDDATGKRVPLDKLRGKDSPLKEVEKKETKAA